MGKISARYQALERAKASKALALWRRVGRWLAAHQLDPFHTGSN
jgi:hypothetical protein